MAAPVAGLLLGLLLPALAAGSSLVGVSSPLLVWSSRGALGQGEGNQQVSYQVVSDSADLASKLVLQATGRLAVGATQLGRVVSGGAGDDDGAVVVYIGSQLDAADLRHGAAEGLDAILSGAQSSLVMPYASSKGSKLRSVLLNQLDAAAVSYKAVGCGAPAADLAAEVRSALELVKNSEAEVLLVCSAVEAAQDGTNAGLQQEMDHLKAVQAEVEASGMSHVFVYASQPKAAAAGQGLPLGSKRRSLLAFSGFGPYTSCGTLCQTQVRWLEGMLAMLVLALASCAGLVCLNILDTPTRFDAPKDSVSTQ